MDESQLDLAAEQMDETELQQTAEPARARPNAAMWVCCLLAVVALIGYGVWRTQHADPLMPLAVTAANATAAGQAAEHAGVEVEWREGHPWVASADAKKASEAAAKALASARPVHPAAVADESVFLSSEASRARRLAATMSAVEQMIESQTGVQHARVVLAEAGRAGAPGSSYAGATAAVAVTMASGEMSQDLVDSVAALVSGSVPGLDVEHVAVIDANANRQRTPRGTEERRTADARRDRERELMDRLRAGVPGAGEARVSVRVDENGVPVATMVMTYAYGLRALDSMSAGSAEEALLVEEDRLTQVAQSVLNGADGCGNAVVHVTVARAPEEGTPFGAFAAPQPELGASTSAPVTYEERVAATSSVGTSVAASVSRERTTPLGPSNGAKATWNGWTMVLLAVAVCAVAVGMAVATRRSHRNAAAALVTASHGTALGTEEPDVEEVNAALEETPEPAEEYAPDTANASDAVRSDPSQAAAVLRAWLDTGYDARVAHVVVALDSGAAGALLRAMPASQVNRVTVALAELRTPSAPELEAAAEALVHEMAVAQGSSGTESGSEYAAEGVA